MLLTYSLSFSSKACNSDWWNPNSYQDRCEEIISVPINNPVYYLVLKGISTYNNDFCSKKVISV